MTVPVTHEPLYNNCCPEAHPPVQAVPVAEQAETAPVERTVYP